jgi:hypothetical protein
MPISIAPSHPFSIAGNLGWPLLLLWKRIDDFDEVAELVADLDPGPGGIPVLLRQYLKLGGQVLAFNVDRQFSDVLDGLIVVDLARTERKTLERYLGRDGAAEFLSQHAPQPASDFAACA